MDYYKFLEKRSMKPERLVKILSSHGTVVSVEIAEKVLDLVYKLSNLSMTETLKNPPERYITANRKRLVRHEKKAKNHENS